MAIYDVSPTLVPGVITVEAEDEHEAIEQAIQDGVELMEDRRNWTAVPAPQPIVKP